MKLYYSPGACSLAVHIVLSEIGKDYETEAVNLGTKTSVSGDFNKINPKGSVPAIMLENGEVLTEGAVILQYLAQQNLHKKLLPELPSFDHYRSIELLNYIATELHKGFGPLFGAARMVKNPEGRGELKQAAILNLQQKISYLSNKLGEHDYISGKDFSILDAYLFTVLNWAKPMGIELSEWSNLENYMKRMKERPAVQKAMKEEGLIKG